MTAALLALASALLLWSPHRPAARRLRQLGTAHPPENPTPSDLLVTRLNHSGASRDGPKPLPARGTPATAGLLRRRRLTRLQLAQPMPGQPMLARPMPGGPVPGGQVLARPMLDRLKLVRPMLARLKVVRLKRTRQAGPAVTGLAGAFDLLAACLVAGMPVPTAVRAVADQFPRHLAEVLRETADLLALGASPPDAWARAVDCAELAQLARGARRSARSGTALAELARGLARRAREQVVDAAEARAQRAGVLIAGPLALCFLPAFLCLGIAPVVVGLASTFF